METYSTEKCELTEERLISVIREQGRRLESQRKELASLSNIRKRDVSLSSVKDSFLFFCSVLFNKIKLW